MESTARATGGNPQLPASCQRRTARRTRAQVGGASLSLLVGCHRRRHPDQCRDRRRPVDPPPQRHRHSRQFGDRAQLHRLPAGDAWSGPRRRTDAWRRCFDWRRRQASGQDPRRRSCGGGGDGGRDDRCTGRQACHGHTCPDHGEAAQVRVDVCRASVGRHGNPVLAPDRTSNSNRTMLRLASRNGYLAFDADECRKFGRSLAEEYQTASPFPHVVIDDFLPADLLRQVLADFPSTEGEAFFDRDQERFKFQLSPNESKSAVVRNLFAELNGEAFVAFLEEMTGIAGLIPDPHFVGGGLHETKTGGHLGIHADFNIHEELKLERKLNLLIYLNEDWPEEFGGALELWDRSMKACEKKVAPV